MGNKTISTEEKILEAAKQIFMKYGLYGSRMQDIADLAGINKALLHYYFRNKEKLFDAVFNKALEKYFTQILQFGDSTLTIKERLFTYVDNIFAFYEEYPQMMLFIIKEASINPEAFFEQIKQLKTDKPTLIPMLKEAIEKGEIKEIDPVIFLVNLHSLSVYPFIASPVFRGILKYNGRDWEVERTEAIKNSVKEFITLKIN